jgi:hypothetical protein
MRTRVSQIIVVKNRCARPAWRFIAACAAASERYRAARLNGIVLPDQLPGMLDFAHGATKLFASRLPRDFLRWVGEPARAERTARQ